MAERDQFLTSREFASKAGISTSSVTKLIRDGKIKAEKKSGKWMISPDQLKSLTVKNSRKPGVKAAGKKSVEPAKKTTTAKKSASTEKDVVANAKTTVDKTYSVAEFAGMTYLTEFGVKQWLKQGRLIGQRVTGGEWRIDASNLEVPDVKRLVRPD